MTKEDANEQPILHYGSDGWLYLNSGNNPFFAYLRKEKCLTKSTIRLWRDLLVARHNRLSGMSISYCHVFAPEKASVYPEFISEPVDISRSHINVLSRDIPGLFINLLPYFNKIKNNFQLYYKTDTHWTFEGCYAAYQIICAHLKIEPNKTLTLIPSTYANALLDLGSKASPPIRERIKVKNLQKNYKRIYANILIDYKEKNHIENEVGLHVGSHAIFRNKVAPNSKKVLIFGDSFSEYRPTLLTAMMAETVSEVHFIWSSNIDYEYVERVKPDIVITELCERFAGVVPDDIFNLVDYEKSRLNGYLRRKSQRKR